MDLHKLQLLSQACLQHRLSKFSSSSHSKPQSNPSHRSNTPDPKRFYSSHPYDKTPMMQAPFDSVSPYQDLHPSSCDFSHLPFTLKVIQQYFTQICSTIKSGLPIPKQTLGRASSILKALDDTASRLPNLSVLFYNLVRQVLKQLFELKQKDDFDYRDLSEQLLELATFIQEGRYVSSQHPVSKYEDFVQKEDENLSLEELRDKVVDRLKFITVKRIGVIGKLVQTDEELKNVVKAYLILMSGLDQELDMKNGSVVQIIKNFVAIPGKAIQTTRKVLQYVREGRLSSEVVRGVSKILKGMDYNKIRVEQKSGSALILYEFLMYTVRYYQKSVENSPKSKKKINQRSFSTLSSFDLGPFDFKPTKKRSQKHKRNFSVLSKPTTFQTPQKINKPKSSPAKQPKFIRKNILLTNIQDTPSQENIQQALNQIQLEDDFIDFLKLKVTTFVNQQESESPGEVVQKLIQQKVDLVNQFLEINPQPQKLLGHLSDSKSFLVFLHRAFVQHNISNCLELYMSSC